MADDDLVAFRQALADRRRAGEPFDHAFDAELAALPAGPEPSPHALASILWSCRSAWRRAYENAPQTTVDRAAARLGEALAMLDEDAPLLQPRREAPPPSISIRAPTPAGAAAAAAFRRRGWWKAGGPRGAAAGR